MSYSESGNNTVFSYDIDKLFKRVRNRTATRVKLDRDAIDGKHNYDDTALTDQERADFDQLCPRAAVAVFQLLQGLAQGITDAYQYAQDSTNSFIQYTLRVRAILDPDDPYQETYLRPKNFDPNIVPILDNQIESVLEYHIVKEWFRMIGMMNQMAEVDNLYKDAVSDLRSSVANRLVRDQRKYRIM
jgi:hypothetical protein